MDGMRAVRLHHLPADFIEIAGCNTGRTSAFIASRTDAQSGHRFQRVQFEFILNDILISLVDQVARPSGMRGQNSSKRTKLPHSRADLGERKSQDAHTNPTT